jgi:hypothetical protein
MEIIRQTTQNILVYVVMMAVLRELVTKEGFLEIFRFVSGVILILICLSSLLSLVVKEDAWYQSIEENLFQEDIDWLKQEITVSEGNLEQVLWEECETQLKEQIQKMAQSSGEKVEEVLVTTEKNEEGELVIKEVSLRLEGDTGHEERQKKRMKKIKKKICKKYELSDEAVKVWRRDGETISKKNF